LRSRVCQTSLKDSKIPVPEVAFKLKFRLTVSQEKTVESAY